MNNAKRGTDLITRTIPETLIAIQVTIGGLGGNLMAGSISVKCQWLSNRAIVPLPTAGLLLPGE
jgi:hypothetical protein